MTAVALAGAAQLTKREGSARVHVIDLAPALAAATVHAAAARAAHAGVVHVTGTVDATVVGIVTAVGTGIEIEIAMGIAIPDPPACVREIVWKPNALDGPSTTLVRSPVSTATAPMISSSRTASASEVLRSGRSSPRMMTEIETGIGIETGILDPPACAKEIVLSLIHI